eukprot:CAMPEP_0181482136 /NCGR_PEP_ID=MMETSP1110-20121109/44678_1 /TAXON_ID=174948 /ORGANISM="Symbiodinium sp., Strain CCMP421" /LENGTH=67 /DNA_ID=CAMNT_0023607663 /DNA_START=48 /DNA_END=254 /DNA_ORIENTATION=+
MRSSALAALNLEPPKPQALRKLATRKVQGPPLPLPAPAEPAEREQETMEAGVWGTKSPACALRGACA